ncbi:unnamed protein product [Durusdinium trenchii]|uniref:Uncharacterized protein n=1 Tax=Durusdinium trenchii TaxID=1381693 RepID=A0ABP0IRC0_9DINO
MAHFLIFTLILAAHGSEIQVVSNDFSFAMVNHATGLAECWGDVKYGGDCSGVNFAGVRQVKANSRSMAVLTSTGGSCWGYTAYGGDCSTIGLSGMTELHSTDLSYLAFDAVGQRGICWGHSSYGGSCGAIDFSQVTKISSNKYAYVAYSASTHTLQCWGSSSYGGNCEASAFTGSSLSEVTELIASIGALVAFDRTAGTISCWGSSAYGGDCSSVTLTGITEVHTNGKAFVALNKNSGLGQCWGGSGGNCSGIDFSGDVQIYSTQSAFLAWKSGSGQCWGDLTRGGNCSAVNWASVKQIYSNDYAFLALDSSGVAQCWGLEGYGGNCQVGNLDGFEIYSSSTVFAAINSITGLGHCWGQETYGGSCSTLDFTGVTDVWANSRAFLAVDRNLHGQAWGASAQGADVSAVNFLKVLTMPTTVTQTTSPTSATATRTVTGTTVTATKTDTATQTTATVTGTGTTVSVTNTGTTVTGTTSLTTTLAPTVPPTTELPSTSSTSSASGQCLFICHWFMRSNRFKSRFCGMDFCSGCEQCDGDEVSETTTTTVEMPVCSEVCKQYKGSAANGGWKKMALLCVQEKKNGKHKCYVFATIFVASGGFVFQPAAVRLICMLYARDWPIRSNTLPCCQLWERKGDPEKCKALLLYSLQRAAEAVLAERQAPPDGLQRLLPDFEALAASKASWAMDICSLAGRLLSALAAKLWNSGRKTDAARWTQKAAELLSVKPEAAAEAAGCWVSAGQCLRLMGDLDGALVCARQAVQVSEDAEAQLLCLELSCEQVKAGHETTEAFLCMQKLHKQPSLRRSQAARAAEAVQKQPSEELTLAGWELFVMCTAKEESGSNSDLCGLTVAAQLVTRAAELQKPSEELQRLLALASQAADACRAPLMAELRSGSGAGSWAIRQLVLVAWSQGQALGRSGQWSWSSAMFAAGHQLLASCEAPPPVPPSPAPDRSSARAREFVDARAWCLISDASAQLQQAKEDGGSLKGAMALLEKAHRLCQRSRELEKQGIHGEVPFSSAASCQRRFLILVLLEFEVRCLEGVAEQELRCFVDEATSSERLSVKCLLALSKIAASQSRRRLAIHCLQSYLIRSTGGSDPDFEQILPAYREILSLHACRNDCLEVFDGILNVLKSKSVNVSDEREKPCVKDEIQWLVATAWNNGAHFFRLQHYRWAEEWMKKSLALAKFSPGLPSEKMTEGYMACLKHCT